jgi:hypothetical protein
MPVRALALLVALLPAAAAAQETVVLASAGAEAPPEPLPQPTVVPGGAIRLAEAPPATPGLWLGF